MPTCWRGPPTTTQPLPPTTAARPARLRGHGHDDLRRRPVIGPGERGRGIAACRRTRLAGPKGRRGAGARARARTTDHRVHPVALRSTPVRLAIVPRATVD